MTKKYTKAVGGSNPMVTPKDYKLDKFNLEHKPTKISLWIKFLLLFKKERTSYDIEYIDGCVASCKMKYKTLKDKNYIISTKCEYSEFGNKEKLPKNYKLNFIFIYKCRGQVNNIIHSFREHYGWEVTNRDAYICRYDNINVVLAGNNKLPLSKIIFVEDHPKSIHYIEARYQRRFYIDYFMGEPIYRPEGVERNNLIQEVKND